MSNKRDIDTVLSRPAFALGLNMELEDQFDNHMEEHARRQITTVLAVILVLTILGLFSDANAGVLQQALVWRVGVQLPIILLGILAVMRPSFAAGWIWLAGALPLNVVVVVTMLLAVQTQPPMTDRMAVIAGIAALSVNLVLPIKFKWALALSVANVLAFVGIPLFAQSVTHVSHYLDVLLFMSAIVLLSTVLVHTRERSQKQTFFLNLINKRQAVELQKLVNELGKLAYLDPLTGAGNRRSFNMQYEMTWRTALTRRQKVSLIIIDIDHFKLFNDAVGHSMGDVCLQAVAKAIATGANCPVDKITRYGGEEFALVTELTNDDLAEAIRKSVASLELPHPGLRSGSIVTVSIGKASVYPGRAGVCPADLINVADEALYEAKREGRNRVVVKDGFFAKAA